MYSWYRVTTDGKVVESVEYHEESDYQDERRDPMGSVENITIHAKDELDAYQIATKVLAGEIYVY